MTCPICWGKGHKTFCINCGKVSKPKKPKKRKKRLTDLEEIQRAAFKAREKFFADTYKKLKAFNMPSTGSPDVDAEIIKRFGEWR